MASIISASTSTGVQLTGDTSGNLALQTQNGANTITVPNSTGTMALTTTGTPLADVWYLNTGFAVNATTIDLTTNLSQQTATGTNVIGTMTQSSGVFTFPQTGLYRVAFSAQYYSNANASRFTCAIIQISTDGGSTWNQVAQAQSAIPAIIAGSNTFSNPFTELQVNANSTANIKVKFTASTTANVNLNGGSGPVGTMMVFQRLGNSV